ALPDAPVVLALVEHAEGASDDAVAASVADVLLDDDGAELRAKERARRADVQASRLRAVLAHVGAHEPAEPGAVVVRLEAVFDQLLAGGLLHPGVGSGLGHAVHRNLLLDERHVAPAIRPQGAAVVVGLAGESEPPGRDLVPFLAGDLARLAADADGGIGE